MNSVERVKQLCKERKIPISKLEKDLGFSNGYIGQLRKGVFPSDRLVIIADYFGVSVNYLMDEKRMTLATCKDCGYNYDPSSPIEVEEHNMIHASWQNAVNKFGTLYCDYQEREKIKSENRNIRDDTRRPINERVEAEIKVLRCLFSRSVIDSGFDTDHVTFEHYVAMMNKNSTYCKHIDAELHALLVKRYGIEDGISSGSRYNISKNSIQTIAAHKEGNIFTQEELQKIEDYKKLLLAARPKG